MSSVVNMHLSFSLSSLMRMCHKVDLRPVGGSITIVGVMFFKNVLLPWYMVLVKYFDIMVRKVTPSPPRFCRRRCKIAESLVEKNFDLAFQVIYEFNLPGSHYIMISFSILPFCHEVIDQFLDLMHLLINFSCGYICWGSCISRREKKRQSTDRILQKHKRDH